MRALSTADPSAASSTEMPAGAIPVLLTVVPEGDVSQAMRDALEARAQDKYDWLSLEAHLLETLRPEMERLTTELVRGCLREAWRQRSGIAID
jgi:hypothetical protein